MTGRKCSAAQVPSFIRPIIMPDMHQSARFARQGMLNGHLGSAAITGSRHIQRRMVILEANIIPPLVRRQAITIQPIWEYPKPCASGGTVLLIPSRHGRFVPAAAVKKDLLILEPIPSSRQASLGGARTMSPRVKPSGRVHKGHCQVTSCCKRVLVKTWGSVHRVADCQPPQLDAVSEELAVLPIDLNRGDTKKGSEEVSVYHLLQEG